MTQDALLGMEHHYSWHNALSTEWLFVSLKSLNGIGHYIRHINEKAVAFIANHLDRIVKCLIKLRSPTDTNVYDRAA